MKLMDLQRFTTTPSSNEINGFTVIYNFPLSPQPLQQLIPPLPQLHDQPLQKLPHPQYLSHSEEGLIPQSANQFHCHPPMSRQSVIAAPNCAKNHLPHNDSKYDWFSHKRCGPLSIHFSVWVSGRFNETVLTCWRPPNGWSVTELVFSHLEPPRNIV